MSGFFVGVMPFLVHSAMRAKHLTVIGAKTTTVFVVGFGCPESVYNASDLVVDCALQLVVDAAARSTRGWGASILPHVST